TALNSAERNLATRRAKGLPLAILLPAAKRPFPPLPLAPVGDSSFIGCPPTWYRCPSLARLPVASDDGCKGECELRHLLPRHRPAGGAPPRPSQRSTVAVA